MSNVELSSAWLAKKLRGFYESTHLADIWDARGEGYFHDKEKLIFGIVWVFSRWLLFLTDSLFILRCIRFVFSGCLECVGAQNKNINQNKISTKEDIIFTVNDLRFLFNNQTITLIMKSVAPTKGSKEESKIKLKKESTDSLVNHILRLSKQNL